MISDKKIQERLGILKHEWLETLPNAVTQVSHPFVYADIYKAMFLMGYSEEDVETLAADTEQMDEIAADFEATLHEEHWLHHMSDSIQAVLHS